MTLLTIVGTLAAGAVGAALRAWVVAAAPRAGTASVNLLGTALLALVLAGASRELLDAGVAVALGVGLSGSLTTFSGWMALVANGLQDRPWHTLVLDLLLPTLVAVGITVLVFAVLI